MLEMPLLSVSECNTLVNQHLSMMGELVVEGEISQLTLSQGKWIFGEMKDNDASVGLFGFAGTISNYKELQEGMLVHVWGTPRLYEKTGRFSLQINKIQPIGEGALKIAFDKLKARLDSEGLFAIERKRPLPRLPRRIGLITAKDSRAYSDFIKVLSERLGGMEISFYPINVQGDQAVPTLLEAVQYFNQHSNEFDVLVITRGGGSLEDLISFNDERAVRAIFGSKVPTICGIGHEADISLVELAADRRASTPSNCAELLVPDRNELRVTMEGIIHRMETKTLAKVQPMQQRLVRTLHAISNYMSGMQTQVQQTKQQILYAHELKTIQMQKKVDMLAATLKNTDPQVLLSKGFSYVMTENGSLVSSIKSVQPGDILYTTVSDGTYTASVTTKHANRE